MSKTIFYRQIKISIEVLRQCSFSGSASCHQRAKEKASAIYNHPKIQHLKLVLSFFLFKFVLQTVDTVTDVVTAMDFFNNGHIYWGCCTIGIVFLPFGARIIPIVAKIGTCYKITKISTFPFFKSQKNGARLKVLSQELPSLLWTFPLFQPLRQVWHTLSNHIIMFIYCNK